MSTETLEFNALRTLKVINKDNLLQKVYINKAGNYGYTTLLGAAQANELADDVLVILEDIFKEIITKSDSHKKLYNEVVLKETQPRRYGKAQIQADIKKQDGKATTLQKTMLNLANLKAMNANLMSKGVSDQFKGTQKLSKEELRTINAAIRDFEKKVKPILKKKRG